MAKNNEVSLHDLKVPAPASLNISEDASASAVVRWWDAAKEFNEAMADLGRIVVLNYDPDSAEYYLASVPEVPRVP